MSQESSIVAWSSGDSTPVNFAIKVGSTKKQQLLGSICSSAEAGNWMSAAK
jgi:hypothetical protein